MVSCKCGKTQNLARALRCDRCGDSVEKTCADDPAFTKRCSVCGVVLADMTGADRDAFFVSGKCCACGGKRE